MPQLDFRGFRVKLLGSAKQVMMHCSSGQRLRAAPVPIFDSHTVEARFPKPVLHGQCLPMKAAP